MNLHRIARMNRWYRAGWIPAFMLFMPDSHPECCLSDSPNQAVFLLSSLMEAIPFVDLFPVLPVLSWHDQHPAGQTAAFMKKIKAEIGERKDRSKPFQTIYYNSKQMWMLLFSCWMCKHLWVRLGPAHKLKETQSICQCDFCSMFLLHACQKKHWLCYYMVIT